MLLQLAVSLCCCWPLVPPCYRKPWRCLKFLSLFCKFSQLTSFCWLFLSTALYVCPLLLISCSTVSWGLLSHTWKISAGSSLVALSPCSSTPTDHTHRSQCDLPTVWIWPRHSNWGPSLVTHHLGQPYCYMISDSLQELSQSYLWIHHFLSYLCAHPSTHPPNHPFTVHLFTHFSVYPSIHPFIPRSITQ